MYSLTEITESILCRALIIDLFLLFSIVDIGFGNIMSQVLSRTLFLIVATEGIFSCLFAITVAGRM